MNKFWSQNLQFERLQAVVIIDFDKRHTLSSQWTVSNSNQLTNFNGNKTQVKSLRRTIECTRRKVDKRYWTVSFTVEFVIRNRAREIRVINFLIHFRLLAVDLCRHERWDEIRHRRGRYRLFKIVYGRDGRKGRVFYLGAILFRDVNMCSTPQGCTDL